MADGTETAPAEEPSQSALIEVVKGLRHQPPLLFGIGAGLVVVALLAVTTNLAVVLVVAALLVAALAAWLVRETRADRRPAGSRAAARANVDRATIRDADVAIIEDEGGAAPGGADVEVNARGAEITGGTIGAVRRGRGSRDQG